MSDKKVIESNFSKYAEFYDSYSTIQNICAQELISQIKANGFKKILDIGCGTGNYTRLLCDKFPKSEIQAIDLSKEMVKIAQNKLSSKRIKFNRQDAEKLKLENEFDFISSNATFQWFGDLKAALASYKKALKNNGMILFSAFGPLTFYELSESIGDFYKRPSAMSVSGFCGQSEIENILKSIFRKSSLRQKIYTEKYDSLSDLLKKIKYTGIRGNSIVHKGLWTHRTVAKIEKSYLNKFKSIIATYQVFFCRGVK